MSEGLNPFFLPAPPSDIKIFHRRGQNCDLLMALTKLSKNDSDASRFFSISDWTKSAVTTNWPTKIVVPAGGMVKTVGSLDN